jgi:hypothetical protein
MIHLDLYEESSSSVHCEFAITRLLRLAMFTRPLITLSLSPPPATIILVITIIFMVVVNIIGAFPGKVNKSRHCPCFQGSTTIDDVEDKGWWPLITVRLPRI